MCASCTFTLFSLALYALRAHFHYANFASPAGRYINFAAKLDKFLKPRKYS